MTTESRVWDSCEVCSEPLTDDKPCPWLCGKCFSSMSPPLGTMELFGLVYYLLNGSEENEVSDR